MISDEIFSASSNNHCAAFYIKIENMYSVDFLKYHILMFRACGLWPNERGSWLYDCWSTIFIVGVAIAFPLSQLVCVLFVDSMDAIVEHLVLSSTVVMASVKGINVLIQKRKLVQLFGILNQMDENVTIEERKYKEIFDPIRKNCNTISLTFVAAYGIAWLILVLQAVFTSAGSSSGWSSTYLYPSEYLHKPSIYIGGLIYQATSNLFLCELDAALDTYAVILVNILVGHIDVLKIQLQEFDAKERSKNDPNQYKSLIYFCENFDAILRYDEYDRLV